MQPCAFQSEQLQEPCPNHKVPELPNPEQLHVTVVDSPMKKQKASPERFEHSRAKPNR